MSIETLYVMRSKAPRAGFQDLDLVTLTAAATTDEGDVMPEGSEGTIVCVFGNGQEFMVEFAEPVGALVTVGPEGIRATDP